MLEYEWLFFDLGSTLIDESKYAHPSFPLKTLTS